MQFITYQLFQSNNIRYIKQFIAFLILTIAVSINLLRWGLNHIENYKPTIENLISQQLEQKITIKQLSAQLHDFNPQIFLQQVQIDSIDKSAQHPAILIKEIQLELTSIIFILYQNWLTALSVKLIGVQCTLQKTDSSWTVMGLKQGTQQQSAWLTEGRNYQLIDSNITWLLNQQAITTHVDVSLHNSKQEHRLNTLIQLTKPVKPNNNSAELRLSAQITGSDLFTSDATVFIETKHLPLALINDFFEQNPNRLIISQGETNIKLWTQFQAGQLRQIQGLLSANNLELVHSNNTVNIALLNSQFQAKLENQQWQIDVDELQLADNQHNMLFDACFRLNSAKQAWHKLSAQLKYAKLSANAQVIRLFLPETYATALAQAQLQGELSELAIFAENSAQADQPYQIAINGKVTDLSFRAGTLLPVGVDHFNGQFIGTPQQGHLHLLTSQASINLPALYSHAIPIEQIHGVLNWHTNKDEWRITSQALQIGLNGLQINSRLAISSAKNQTDPFLDLQLSLNSDDIGQLKTYLPDKAMSADNLSWLTHALVSGRVEHGKLLFYGKTKDFPFTDHSGVFEAILPVNQGVLQYASDWPVISAIQADVLFWQNQLQVKGYHGVSDELQITYADVVNPALGTSPTLSIAGTVQGKIPQVLHFLMQSPLQARVSALQKAIRPRGDTEVKFNIDLPLLDDSTPKVQGSARLAQADLIVNALDLPVSKITGQLFFNEQGLYSPQLTAVALASPIQIAIEQISHATRIQVAGKTTIATLARQFPLSIWSTARGTTAYQLQLDLPTGHEPATLTVQSQLAGVSLALPNGLAKTAEQTRALTVRFDLVEGDHLPIYLDYDHQLKALLGLIVSQQRLYAGHIIIGEGEIGADQLAGFYIDIHCKHFDINQWLSLFGLFQAQAGLGSSLQGISIYSEQAEWQNKPLGALSLMIRRQQQQWQAQIHSRVATGAITIPDDYHTQAIKLALRHLDLFALTQLLPNLPSTDTTTLQAVDLPLVSIESENVVWQGYSLGRLQLATERVVQGIKLKTLQLANASANLQLSGSWQQFPSKALTQIQGQLTSQAVGHLLRQTHLSKELSNETHGRLDFNLLWQSNPQALRVKNMQGQADLFLQNGRILNIEPGLGRLLGVLAMSQWTKRLQLDFSDLYAQGLSFNSIKGHFDIVQGVAISKDLTIDAIPALITISGTSDLANQTLDELIKVTPKSAEAVPIAGNLLGGISSVMTGKSYDELFFGVQYRALGTWQNPQLIPIHAQDGLVQKLWRGLKGLSPFAN